MMETYYQFPPLKIDHFVVMPVIGDSKGKVTWSYTGVYIREKSLTSVINAMQHLRIVPYYVIMNSFIAEKNHLNVNFVRLNSRRNLI